jgi:hypothetical protein
VFTIFLSAARDKEYVMKCFNHPEKDAVVVCKACGKAVCRDCGIKTGNGFVCQQSCTETLAEINELQARQLEHLKNIKRLNFLGAFFSICMGLLFIYFSSLGYGIVYNFVLLLGLGFTFYGVVAQLVNIVIFLKSRKKKINS